MRWLLDSAYLLVLLLTAPVWVFRLLVTGKWRSDWRGRFGQAAHTIHAADPAIHSPRVLIHAVSVGEVNATRTLMAELVRQAPGVELVICATTNTGYDRACELYGEQHHVCRYPLDLSWAVHRFLDRLKPDIVVLIELELWPNFAAACQERNIKLCIVNGRLSERSHRRYAILRPFVRPTFQRVAFAAVQNDAYAERFRHLGLPADRVVVTDTMKWDTAPMHGDVPEAEALAAQMGIDRTRPLIVAGSTAPEEHVLFRDVIPSGVQLLCAPRRPEWFDQAASVLTGCARRSRGDQGSRTDRFLLDTMGELRVAYALADLVIVGRSFGERFGSDMMEPVALGKPTIVGPAVADFQHTVEALLAGGGLVQTTAAELPEVLERLLESSDQRRTLAENGRSVIEEHRGASRRHAEMILHLLDKKTRRPSRAGTTKEEKEERAMKTVGDVSQNHATSTL